MNSTTKVAGIVFDKDGTLFDFQRSWSAFAERFIAQEAGGDANRAKAIAEVIGFDPGARRFRADSTFVAATPEETVEGVFRLTRDQDPAALVTRINALAAGTAQVPAVDLPRLLSQLSGMGLKLGVATNDAEAPARRHLADAEILERFDFIAGSDSGFGAKPETGQLDAFCAALGLEPSACLMVGDSLHDLVSGRAAGMGTVAVLTGAAGRDDLSPAADVVLDDIDGLPEYVGSLGR